MDAPERADYWAAAEESVAEADFWVDAKKSYFLSALTLLEEETGPGRLLDIGGGLGFFAELAMSRGWDAYSLDVSSKAATLAAGRIGNHRALTSLDSAQLGTFDVASLWCVIAHTDDPASLLQTAAHALRRGGIVWMTTPNFAFQKPYAALRAVLRRPIDFAGEGHIGHFTPQALENLLRRGGFQQPSFRYCGISETCIVAGSRSPYLLALKRGWNRAAYVLAGLGLANYMSELQIMARRVALPPAAADALEGAP